MSSVDELKSLQQPCMVEQIEQNTLKRQRFEGAFPERGGGNFRDKLCCGMEFGTLVVQSIHVLHQRQILTAKTFRQEKRPGITPMRWDTAQRRRMFPEGVWRYPGKNHPRSSANKQRQEVPENRRWNGYNPIGC